MKFKADDDKLTITFDLGEMVWALRRRLIIPRSSITSMDWTPQFNYEGQRFFRIGGTNLPGLLYAGNFYSAAGWYFLYLVRPRSRSLMAGGIFSAPNVLDIATQDFRYKRIMLTCREDIGVSLINWWHNA